MFAHFHIICRGHLCFVHIYEIEEITWRLKVSVWEDRVSVGPGNTWPREATQSRLSHSTGWSINYSACSKCGTRGGQARFSSHAEGDVDMPEGCWWGWSWWWWVTSIADVDLMMTDDSRSHRGAQNTGALCCLDSTQSYSRTHTVGLWNISAQISPDDDTDRVCWYSIDEPARRSIPVLPWQQCKALSTSLEGQEKELR